MGKQQKIDWLQTNVVAAATRPMVGHTGHGETRTQRAQPLLIAAAVIGFAVVCISAMVMAICSQQTGRQALWTQYKPFSGEQIAGHVTERKDQLEQHGKQREALQDQMSTCG